MSSSIHGRNAPASVAVNEVLEFRKAYRAFDLHVPVGAISFGEDDGGNADNDSSHLMLVKPRVSGGKERVLRISGSGTRSLSNVLGVPYQLLSRLACSTVRAVFEDLLESKFRDPKRFVTLRCLNSPDGQEVLRAVTTNRKKILDDPDIFLPILRVLPDRFEAKDYWADDFNTAIRLVENIDSEYLGVTYRLGFDVVNTEVRESGTEVKGLVSFKTDHGWFDALIPRRLNPGLVSITTSAALVSEVRKLISRMENPEDRDRSVSFLQKWLVPGDVLLGRELRVFADRKMVRQADIVPIILGVQPDMNEAELKSMEPEEVTEYVSDVRTSRFDLVRAIGEYAAADKDFDSYFRRASLELIANTKV